MNPYLIGLMAYVAVIFEILNSKKGNEIIRQWIDGVKTRKEDLEVNWEVLRKAEKEVFRK